MSAISINLKYHKSVQRFFTIHFAVVEALHLNKKTHQTTASDQGQIDTSGTMSSCTTVFIAIHILIVAMFIY